jgi:transcriptional regulator with XRE-family HTH domain
MGEKIKTKREAAGLTVTQLARILGKARTTVYRYESNGIENLPSSVLEPLAAALHTTTAYLLSRDGAEPTGAIDPELQKIYDNLNDEGKSMLKGYAARLLEEM